MPQATYHFPAGFLWGSATSSHQVEGQNTNNNWYAWEQVPGHILNGDKSGLASDWWGGRWREDLDRAAACGQNAHRMSIEWSRIQPTPDRWDEEALEHYRQIIRGIVTRKMTPLITLHHFTDPLWLTERGAWENPETPALFDKYVAKVVSALKEYVNLWVTINEPNVYAQGGYLAGGFPPGKYDFGLSFKVFENLVRGHAAAYRTIHRIQREARVGIASNYRTFMPARPWLPFDRYLANFFSWNFNEGFACAITDGRVRWAFHRSTIPEAAHTQDFFGLNYYTTDLIAFAPTRTKELFMRRSYAKDADISGTGFIANIPEGLFKGLKWAETYKLPILITENGVEDSEDVLRPRYLVEHLHQVWRAVNFNWPIKGYFHWSQVDNFEWDRGWTQRFGLWGLNTETQERIRRPSVDLYRAICKENGISTEMVAQYAPGSLAKLYP